MQLTATKQKQTDKNWTDESGLSIPFSRITELEKFKELQAFNLLKAAAAMNSTLVKFKEDVAKVCEQLAEKANEANKTKGKPGKGNYTWYNFDHSIKIEVRVNQIRSFDDLTISSAKEKLEECIKVESSGTAEFLQGLVLDALEKKNGKMDVDKVLGLKKHKSRTTNPLFHEAMDLIDQAIRVKSSKTYFTISQRLENGGYEPVNLDFASI